MTKSSDLLLCFQTADPREAQVALDYWNMDTDGRWASTVTAIAERLGVKKHILPDLVRGFAQAYDVSIRCAQCHRPRQINSRSDASTRSYGYRSWGYGGECLCEECAASRATAQRAREQAELEQRRQNLRTFIRRISPPERTFAYEHITYFDAMIVYAIMLASDVTYQSGELQNPRELALLSGDQGLIELLNRLFKSGILLFSEDTPIDAVDLSSVETDGSYRYFPLKTKWRLARDTNGRSFPAVFEFLGSLLDSRGDCPGYEQAVHDLWWILGNDIALHYMEEQLTLHRLSDYEPGDKTHAAIRYALERFSIPQVRNLIWRVVRDVAALSTRQDFSKKHALNTFPGSLIRLTHRALADCWTIRPYGLRWDVEEPSLVPLLFDRVLQTGQEGFRDLTGRAVSAPLRCSPLED